MKNRYLLCLLLCLVLLYFAVPRLAPGAAGLEGVFAISWLAFSFLVIAGNLSALLFSRQNREQKRIKMKGDSEIKRIRGR